MDKAETLESTAVVLPDEGALLPVLHGLPDIEPNISMGYPLERTSLARLVEDPAFICRRIDARDGRYYWKDVVALIRHPYLRLLGPESKPLRKIFHVWESSIRLGEKYVAPMAWEPPYDEKVLEDIDRKMAEPLRLDILDRCLTAFEPVHSLADLGDALARLASLLHVHGETAVAHIPHGCGVSFSSDQLGHSATQRRGNQHSTIQPDHTSCIPAAYAFP